MARSRSLPRAAGELRRAPSFASIARSGRLTFDEWRAVVARGARERIVKRDPEGRKERSEFVRRGKVVAVMLWDHGVHEWGWGLSGERREGLSVEWEDEGLRYLERFVDGLTHGMTYCFDGAGRLLARAPFVRGTGVDLWCTPDGDLAEEAPLRAGLLHGPRRWWHRMRVWWEEPNWDGFQHGIERQWNDRGGFCRGYPRYWIHGKRVGRRAYLRAAQTDRTLPPYRARDDRPRRPMPRGYLYQRGQR